MIKLKMKQYELVCSSAQIYRKYNTQYAHSLLQIHQ